MPKEINVRREDELALLKHFIGLFEKMERFLIDWERMHEIKSRGEEIDEKRMDNAMQQLDKLTRNYKLKAGGFTKEQSENLQRSTRSFIALARSEHGDRVADDLDNRVKWCYEHLENYRRHRSKY